jgi:hypothetical protein
VPAVAAAQVPVASTAASLGEPDCHGMPVAGGDEMPCCPNGTESLQDCLASCTLIAAIPPSLVIMHSPDRTTAIFLDPSCVVASLSEPPLKPPPIA